MSRWLLTLTALALAGALCPAWAHHAPEKPVLISVDGAKKDPVPFDHTKHFAAKPALQQNCVQCHHTVEDTNAPADAAPWKCTACHTLDGVDGALPVKDAMHDKDVGACRSCHFGGDAEKRLKCGDCHTGGS